MAEQSLWRRMVAAVEREYERRIRAASLVTEYGASHHDHHHTSDHQPTGHTETEIDQDDGEFAEIVNVPKGTRLGSHARPTGEE
ncbi:MAG: hypothetical protein AB4911_16570 [Oscillochloridaceae bacterium umkhey_bin13]